MADSKQYIGKTSLAEFYNYQAQLIDSGYQGVDLAKKFKSEIGNTDIWQWIQQRVDNADTDGLIGLNTGDWIEAEMTDTDDDIAGKHMHHMQIMGIDTYYKCYQYPSNTTSPALTNDTTYLPGHHIDFCSKECYGYDTHVWQNDSSGIGNNGNAASTTQHESGTIKSPCPYMCSDLRKYLTGDVYKALPVNIQEVIVDKNMYMESRYKAGADGTAEKLTDSTSYALVNLGKVWAPTEAEVFGSCIKGTPVYSDFSSTQYPLFRTWLGRQRYRFKNTNDDAVDTISWWTSTVCSGSDGDAVDVDRSGISDWNDVDGGWCAPLCFRIAQKQS